jgi:hypothetical protein
MDGRMTKEEIDTPTFALPGGDSWVCEYNIGRDGFDWSYSRQTGSLWREVYGRCSRNPQGAELLDIHRSARQELSK